MSRPTRIIRPTLKPGSHVRRKCRRKCKCKRRSRVESKRKEGKIRRRSRSVFPRWWTRLAVMPWNLFLFCCCCCCCCCCFILPCVALPRFTRVKCKQTQAQMQVEENDNFSIFGVGACICICATAVHTCIFFRLHLNLCRKCEPGLSTSK